MVALSIEFAYGP